MKRPLTKKQLEAKVFELTARHFALRNAVAQLLAIVAATTESPGNEDMIFRDFSESGDKLAADAPMPQTEGQLAGIEWFRDETDWIVHTAKNIVAQAKGPG